MYIKPTAIKNSFTKVMQYHFNKIEKGQGEYVQYGGAMNMISETPLAFSNKMDKISDLNVSGKIKNIGWDISVSFEPGERPNQETLKAIIDDIKNELGFENRAFVLFSHHDMKHFHMHLVVNSMNEEGETNQKMHGFYGKDCVRISAFLEEKYGLLQARESGTPNISLAENSLNEYTLHRNLIKMQQENSTQLQGLPKMEIAMLVQKQLKNKELKEQLKEHPQLIASLENMQLKTTKYVLKARILKLSKEFKESGMPIDQQNWLKFIKQSDPKIYGRYISNKNAIVYGLDTGSRMIYYNEQKLGKGLQFNHLFGQKYQQDTAHKQKTFLKNVVNNALRKSNNLKDFEAYLTQRKIEIVYASNKRGIYGVSFKAIEPKDSPLVKGSDIGVSWNRIQSELSLNQSYSLRIKNEKVYHINPIHINAPKIFKDRVRGSAKGKNSDNEYDNIDFYKDKNKGPSI